MSTDLDGAHGAAEAQVANLSGVFSGEVLGVRFGDAIGVESLRAPDERLSRPAGRIRAGVGALIRALVCLTTTKSALSWKAWCEMRGLCASVAFYGFIFQVCQLHPPHTSFEKNIEPLGR